MFVVSERKQGAPVGTVISERKQRTSWKIPPPPPASVVNNGFGKKILEKFGWNPGEGLGAQKQGMKKHITTKIKNNNQGIGYKSNGEEWLKQQNDFSELLANLSGESTEVKENEVSESNGKNSLEMRSKQSRARVQHGNHKSVDRRDHNNGGCINIEERKGLSHGSGILSESVEVTNTQNDFTEKTKNIGKKNKRKKRKSLETTDISQSGEESAGSNGSPENKEIKKRNKVRVDDVGIESGGARPVKYVRMVNPFLVKSSKETLSSEEDNSNGQEAVDSEEETLETKPGKGAEYKKKKLKTETGKMKNKLHKNQNQSYSAWKQQCGDLIKSCRYHSFIVGKTANTDNINELYYRFVHGSECKTDRSMDSNSLGNNNITGSAEDNTLDTMKKQQTEDTAVVRTQQADDTEEGRGGERKRHQERLLALSNKSRVIRKHKEKKDDLALHTVGGVHRYVKSLDKISILRAVYSFKGANLSHVNGYPTETRPKSSANENTEESKPDVICNDKKTESDAEKPGVSTIQKHVDINTEQQKLSHGVQSSENPVKGDQWRRESTLADRRPAVWS